MSRSRKKEPIYKDPSNTKGKRLVNRKFRRKIKETIQREKETMPLIDEVMNQYDIIDFKTNGHTMKDKEEAERLKRK